MKARQAMLERRRQVLHARIAAQRSLLAQELNALRGPLRAFEVARGVGAAIRRHAAFITAVAAIAGFLVMRGGLFSKTLRTIRVARRTASWLGIARTALRLVQRRPLNTA